MTSKYFKIKRNDREPSYQATLYQGSSPIDLTGCTIRFLMRPSTEGATLKVNSTAVTVVGAATAGVVRYDWALNDTDTEGSYQAEWEITKPNGKKLTVPTDGYNLILIKADLG